MLSSQMSVRASKAAGYFNALCRHFARKVKVEHDPSGVRAHFPMGICEMSLDGETMHFACRADTEQALQQVKMIVSTHINKFGELRDVDVQWTGQ